MMQRKFIGLFGGAAAAWSVAAYAQGSATIPTTSGTTTSLPQIEVAHVRPVDQMPPNALRCLIFRGSIPHPTQLLCTLRDHCRQGSRNTRYQAGAAPYLGPSSTGWIAAACLAPSFNHLIGAHQQRVRYAQAESPCSLEIDR
jgi:hypothetical protein